MKVKFEVKNGKFRFFILNRVLKLLLFIDHAKYKATSSEKCKKKTFQQMAPLNNANLKFRLWLPSGECVSLRCGRCQNQFKNRLFIDRLKAGETTVTANGTVSRLTGVSSSRTNIVDFMFEECCHRVRV